MDKASLPQAIWSMKVPVYFGHCDPAGIVFTPTFFDLLHPVIERFFIDGLGIDYYSKETGMKVALGYGHASCDFLKPVTMGDELDVAVMVERIGATSYTLRLHGLLRGTEAVRARFVTVVMSLGAFRPQPIPPEIRGALEGYSARVG